MANPINGIYLNERFYNYIPGSYRRNLTLKNSATVTQSNRLFQVNGSDLPIHSMTLLLENQYFTYDVTTNNQSAGMTIWLGVSRKEQLLIDLSAIGNSQPLVLVCADGTSHLVLPSGSVNIDEFIAEAPDVLGKEFRVNLTLENYS